MGVHTFIEKVSARRGGAGVEARECGQRGRFHAICCLRAGYSGEWVRRAGGGEGQEGRGGLRGTCVPKYFRLNYRVTLSGW